MKTLLNPNENRCVLYRGVTCRF